jgi:hypothetical protein
MQSVCPECLPSAKHREWNLALVCVESERLASVSATCVKIPVMVFSGVKSGRDGMGPTVDRVGTLKRVTGGGQIGPSWYLLKGMLSKGTAAQGNLCLVAGDGVDIRSVAGGGVDIRSVAGDGVDIRSATIQDTLHRHLRLDSVRTSHGHPTRPVKTNLQPQLQQQSYSYSSRNKQYCHGAQATTQHQPRTDSQTEPSGQNKTPTRQQMHCLTNAVLGQQPYNHRLQNPTNMGSNLHSNLQQPVM